MFFDILGFWDVDRDLQMVLQYHTNTSRFFFANLPGLIWLLRRSPCPPSFCPWPPFDRQPSNENTGSPVNCSRLFEIPDSLYRLIMILIMEKSFKIVFEMTNLTLSHLTHKSDIPSVEGTDILIPYFPEPMWMSGVISQPFKLTLIDGLCPRSASLMTKKKNCKLTFSGFGDFSASSFSAWPFQPVTES